MVLLGVLLKKNLCINFGKEIKRWISTFCAINIKSYMSVSGQHSGWFDVKRRTRQGDPHVFDLY